MQRKIGIAGLWDLVKDYFTTCFVTGIVFLLPYYLISGIEFGLESSFGKSGSKWLSYSIFAVFLILVVKELDHVFEWFENLFSDLKRRVKGASLFKKLIWFLFLYGSFWIWTYPTIAVHIWSLVIIPIGFTYDRYLALKNGNDAIYK